MASHRTFPPVGPDRRDADRLIALRDKAVEAGLSTDEQLERLRLERDREDREPRLRKLLYDATTAQGELDIEQVIVRWDEIATQKDAAYALAEQLTRALHHAWRRYFGCIG